MPLPKEIKEIGSSTSELRKFGITLGIAFGPIGAYFLLRGKGHAVYFLAASGFFLFFGLVFPRVLKPAQTVWMTLALVLGWVMTRVILSVVFYLGVTPVGFLVRLSGKDLMQRKFPGAGSSYWTDRPQRPKIDYERQY